MKGMVTGVDHVGLPSAQNDWPRLRTYYEGLGLDVKEVEITDPDYDYIGTGPRLQVGLNGQLMISFFVGDHPPHVALKLSPLGLASARNHVAFDRETHWGHGKTSVFHDDPASNKVELTTGNPDYHRDDSHD